MGCVVSPVFDTQLAAAFLGLRQQIGYGALVETYTGVHLPKAESPTDWVLSLFTQVVAAIVTDMGEVEASSREQMLYRFLQQVYDHNYEAQLQHIQNLC